VDIQYNLNMNLSGRYGTSIGRSLGCSELHRCERPFRTRPADVIIIEARGAQRVLAQDGWLLYRESPVIKAKEIQIVGGCERRY